MNYLIVGMTQNYGGTESFIMSQIRNKSTHGAVFFLNESNSNSLAYNNEFSSLKINVIDVEISYIHINKFIKKVRYICIKNKIDAIVINVNNTSIGNILELIAAKMADVKIRVVHSHNSYDSNVKGKIKRLINFPFVRHDFFHLISKRLACSANAGTWEFGKKKFQIVKNGIDTNAFKFSLDSRQEIRKSLKIDDTITVFLHVGRISIQKNTNYLVESFIKFHNSNENCILLIAGGAENNEPEYNKMLETIKLHNASDSVLLLGVRRDIPDLMSASDIFLLPSLYEGFPIVAVEAQCSGLLCLLSNTITSDIKLTDNVKFIPIDNDIVQWPNAMQDVYKEYTSINRSDCSEIIKWKGYDIKDSAKEYWNLVTEN